MKLVFLSPLTLMFHSLLALSLFFDFSFTFHFALVMLQAPSSESLFSPKAGREPNSISELVLYRPERKCVYVLLVQESYDYCLVMVLIIVPGSARTSLFHLRASRRV